MSRTVPFLLSFVLVTSLLAVGSPAGAGQRYVDQVFADVVKSPDIVYGHAVNSRGDLEELTLDLYEPAGDTEPFRPVYVWAHGGSFIGGDKSGDDGTVIPEDYTRSGWVTVSINYRLHHDMEPGFRGILFSTDPVGATRTRMATVRDAQRDMQAAVRWLRANAGGYRLDSSRIAAGGFSAGAETALTVAFNADDPADVAFSSDRPADTGNLEYSSTVAAGVSHAGVYAPAIHGLINPGEPPVAMLHGTDDTTVPFPSVVPSCVVTSALLNVCELTPFLGAGHDVLGADLAKDFLRRHVVNGSSWPTSLRFEGEPRARGETVEVAVRLARAGGEPFAGREIDFEFAGIRSPAMTDAHGVARTTLAVPDHRGSQEVTARYHGEPGHAPSSGATTVTWGRGLS